MSFRLTACPTGREQSKTRGDSPASKRSNIKLFPPKCLLSKKPRKILSPRMDRGLQSMAQETTCPFIL